MTPHRTPFAPLVLVALLVGCDGMVPQPGIAPEYAAPPAAVFGPAYTPGKTLWLVKQGDGVDVLRVEQSDDLSTWTFTIAADPPVVYDCVVEYTTDDDGKSRPRFCASVDDDRLGQCVDSGWTSDPARALRVLRRDQARVHRAVADHLDALKPPPKALVQALVETRMKEIREDRRFWAERRKEVNRGRR